MKTTNTARQRLQNLIVLLIAIISISAILSWGQENEFTADTRPPLNTSINVSYRFDGGQVISPASSLEPNILTRLNQGQAIKLASANPTHLSNLPSFGLKSAEKAVASGCLGGRQQQHHGIIIESCDQNKP